MKKGNKIIIVIVAILAFIVIGSIGKSNNEVKVIINKAKEYLNNGEISEAEYVLRDKAGETNNREFKKLWSIAYGYEQVSNKFNLYDHIDWAEEMLDKIDKSYKDYEPTREKIEEVQGLIDEGRYEEAMELSKETRDWQKLSQEDKNTMMDLENQARDLYYEQKTSEKEEERKKQDEEFTVEKAIEYAEDYSLKTGLDTLRVEVDETPQYDEDGRKYYNVGVYIIELDELNEAYRVYSDGKIKRLN